jgi:ribosomal protein L37AE/L43A
MSFNAGSCDECGQPTKERIETATGRLVCQKCSDDITAASAAVVLGGGAGEAVATRGWLRRVREWRLRGRS